MKLHTPPVDTTLGIHWPNGQFYAVNIIPMNRFTARSRLAFLRLRLSVANFNYPEEVTFLSKHWLQQHGAETKKIRILGCVISSPKVCTS